MTECPITSRLVPDASIWRTALAVHRAVPRAQARRTGWRIGERPRQRPTIPTWICCAGSARAMVPPARRWSTGISAASPDWRDICWETGPMPRMWRRMYSCGFGSRRRSGAAGSHPGRFRRGNHGADNQWEALLLPRVQRAPHRPCRRPRRRSRVCRRLPRRRCKCPDRRRGRRRGNRARFKRR